MQPRSDCRVCLTGGRAQSVLHFTQQQTGENTVDRGGERGERGGVSRQKRGCREERGEGEKEVGIHGAESELLY